MIKIDFDNKKTNFFQIASFVRKHNLDHSNILEQAFQQEALMDDNKNLLFNFLDNSLIFSYSYIKICLHLLL